MHQDSVSNIECHHALSLPPLPLHFYVNVSYWLWLTYSVKS